MRLSEIKESNLTKTLIDKLLFEGLEYTGATGDLIMVLGSKKACEYRVPVAARLFFEGKAQHLIFCGGKVQPTKYGELPEYESMLIAAAELSVPRERILTETRSMTTAENLTFSHELISEKLPDCRKIILVTTAYHMRRALMLARRLLPDCEFIPCPAEGGSTRRSSWFANEKGIRTAHDEAMKLKWYAENGYIEDINLKG